MLRFGIVALGLLTLSGAAQAQSIQTIPIDLVPSLKQQLESPQTLYPSGGKNSRAELGIDAAYYTELTDRYGHNIFAKPSEFATLVVKANDIEYKLTLESDVFEDTYPLIFDFDKDGTGEIVTVQSSLTGGGSIAIYALRDGELKNIAQTPNIGTRNRWMNIAGIADFNGDGLIEIALVDRPHIRGELEFWTFTSDGKLEPRISALGFSNHFIGSSAQRLSAVISGGDHALLALPSTDRRTLNLVDASNDEIQIVAREDLGSKIVDNFAYAQSEGENFIGVLLADGGSRAFKIVP